ncbi:MAG: hypothetical protein ACK5MO_11415, partial [Planctomyces sp.]
TARRSAAKTTWHASRHSTEATEAATAGISAPVAPAVTAPAAAAESAVLCEQGFGAQQGRRKHQ